MLHAADIILNLLWIHDPLLSVLSERLERQDDQYPAFHLRRVFVSMKVSWEDVMFGEPRSDALNVGLGPSLPPLSGILQNPRALFCVCGSPPWRPHPLPMPFDSISLTVL